MASTNKKAPVVLIKNGRLTTEQPEYKDFLTLFPSAAYTTARTIQHKSIVEFEAHVSRLAYSFLKLEHKETTPSEEIVQEQRTHLRSILLPALRLGLQAYLSVDPNSEVKISIIITEQDPIASPSSPRQDLHTYIHLTKLVVPSSPTQAELKPSHQEDKSDRENPDVKDAAWARQRKVYEDQMAKDVNEVVMFDHKGHIYEGLSSNFFAVTKDGALETAPKGSVLWGTMQRHLISLCEEANIKVIYQCPSVQDISNWQGAFITSTSRGLLPIEELRLFHQPPSSDSHVPSEVPQIYRFKISPFLEDLRRSVFDSMKRESTQILED